MCSVLCMSILHCEANTEPVISSSVAAAAAGDSESHEPSTSSATLSFAQVVTQSCSSLSVTHSMIVCVLCKSKYLLRCPMLNELL